VREVGIELYQDMLEEAWPRCAPAVRTRKISDTWSPQINLARQC